LANDELKREVEKSLKVFASHTKYSKISLKVHRGYLAKNIKTSTPVC